MNIKICGNKDGKAEDDPDIMVMNHGFSFFNHFKICHVTGEMSEVVPDTGKDSSPDTSTESGEEREPPDIHFRQTGGDGDQLADRGEKSADESGDIAIFAEDFFGSVESLFFEEEVFTVFMEERSSDP